MIEGKFFQATPSRQWKTNEGKIFVQHTSANGNVIGDKKSLDHHTFANGKYMEGLFKKQLTKPLQNLH